MASSRYGARDLVYVPLGTGDTNINYGFNTNMDEADKALLGHVAVNLASPPPRFVLGANRPKPGRATKRSAAASNSSFYAASQTTALRAAGWRVGFPKLRPGKGANGLLSKEYYVTISGIKYAWPLSNDVAARLGDLGQLGLRLTQNTENDYVFGARFPKPPKAASISVGDNGVSSVSTFYDPSVTLPAGFSEVKSAFTTLSL
jgi:hypothetical protein